MWMNNWFISIWKWKKNYRNGLSGANKCYIYLHFIQDYGVLLYYCYCYGINHWRLQIKSIIKFVKKWISCKFCVWRVCRLSFVCSFFAFAKTLKIEKKKSFVVFLPIEYQLCFFFNIFFVFYACMWMWWKKSHKRINDTKNMK